MPRRIWLAAVLLGLVAPRTGADGSGGPLRQLPFTPVRDVVAPGATFSLEVPAPPPAGAAGAGTTRTFDPGTDRATFHLEYEGAPTGSRVALPAVWRRDPSGRILIDLRMPLLAGLPGITTQGGWRGPLHPYDATLVAELSRDLQAPYEVRLPLQVPDRRWGRTWGVLVVLMALAIVAALTRRREAGEGRHWVLRFLASPLQLATTPVGGYSLSQAQIVFWSCITLYGLVLVYFHTQQFLEIPPQILMFLGISGGTAVLTRVLSQDGTVARAIALAAYPRRQPRLRDLIWSGGGPDVFKFQMLTFTLLAGYVAVVEISKTYAFPVIPESLVALMGVSSSVYVGNKVVQKSDADATLERLRKAVDEARSAVAPTERALHQEKLRGLLEELYGPAVTAAHP